MSTPETQPLATGTTASPSPTARELFVAFLFVGLSGFGGTLPFARRMLVEQKRWLTPLEFTEVLSLSQLVPGPNITNITMMVGTRYAGLRGALASVAGLMLMPIAIVLVLGVLYARYGDLPLIERGFYGVSSAAAGLLVATAAKIAWPVLRNARAIVMATLVLIAMVVLRVPLVWVLLTLTPVSLLWTWLTRNER